MINSIFEFDVKKVIELNKIAPTDADKLTYDDLFILHVVCHMYNKCEKNDNGYAFMPSVKIKEEIPLVDIRVEEIRVRLRRLWAFNLIETTTKVIQSKEAFLYIRMGEKFTDILQVEPFE